MRFKIIVEDYLRMLQSELAGEAFNKAEHNRATAEENRPLTGINRIQTPECFGRNGSAWAAVHTRLQAGEELPAPIVGSN